MANTTNYNWETPDDTDLVKDGALAIRTFGSSVDTTTKALNPSTTLGDIEYRSSTANTNTRLGIGTTGQVLTVAGGVPSWAAPAVSSSGLNLINTTAFSGVSTQSINDVFSTTYDNYLILIKLTSASTQRIGMRLRVSGADATGSNYTHINNFNNGSSNSPATATETYFYNGYSYSTLTSNTIEIFSPFLAESTQNIATSRTGSETLSHTGIHSLSTSYTGFTIFGVSAGNINGTISTYGYGK